MEKQYHRIHLRMTKKQYAALKKQSCAAGMTMNKFMMARLMEVQPFVFPTDGIAVLADYTDAQGQRINEIARAFNAGYGSEALLQETLAVLERIRAHTLPLLEEKRMAEAAWLQRYGYVPVKRKSRKGIAPQPESHGLMLRLNPEQHARLRELLRLTRWSQKLFLQRLITRYPIDGNAFERLHAYGNYTPFNRIANNVRQMVVRAGRMGIDDELVERVEYLLRTLDRDVYGLAEHVGVEGGAGSLNFATSCELSL